MLRRRRLGFEDMRLAVLSARMVEAEALACMCSRQQCATHLCRPAPMTAAHACQALGGCIPTPLSQFGSATHTHTHIHAHAHAHGHEHEQTHTGRIPTPLRRFGSATHLQRQATPVLRTLSP